MYQKIARMDLQARQAADRGRYTKAKELYIELLDREPNWEKGAGDYELALVHKQLDEIDDAICRYRSAIEQQQQNQMFRQSLVEFLFEQKLYDECFTTIVDLAEYNAKANADCMDDVFYQYLLKIGNAWNISAKEIQSMVRERVPGFNLFD